MDELLSRILTTARGMWVYRRVALLTTWLVGIAGVGLVLMMPDYYQASARVFVDTQSILRPLMTGIAVQPNIEQQAAMLSRTLISRPTVERLVQTLDLDHGAESKAAKDAVVDAVTKAISIQNAGRDNLYTLSYRDKSPEVAQRVVQALLTIFVESSLGAARQDSDGARRFLEEQIKNYEAKLTEAEGRLKAFKLRNLEMQSTAGLDAAARTAEITNLLSQARLELREAESARAAAAQQLEMLRSQAHQSVVDTAELTVQTPEIDARLSAQKRNLDTLLQRYTDDHPDVINTRRLIKDLEAQKRREVAELQRKIQANPSAPVASADPALVELSRVYSAAEVQVASLRARVAEYQARANRAHEQLKVAPQLEAELAQLNRDYQIHQKNYADLVARRESALMSGELESRSKTVDFRVTDPPRVAPRPVAPNRKLLLPLAFLVAIGAGLGVAFVMAQIRPVFFDGTTLRQLTHLPLLGVVEMVSSDELHQRESRSLKRVMMSFFAFVLLYAGCMVALSFHSTTLR